MNGSGRRFRAVLFAPLHRLELIEWIKCVTEMLEETSVSLIVELVRRCASREEYRGVSVSRT